MFTSMIAASVGHFSKGTPDKHGLEPIILSVIAGKCPNRNVLSGTIAKNNNIEVGKSYLFQVREVEPSEEYGRQFVFTRVGELSAMEALTVVKELGNAVLFDVIEEDKKITGDDVSDSEFDEPVSETAKAGGTARK